MAVRKKKVLEFLSSPVGMQIDMGIQKLSDTGGDIFRQWSSGRLMERSYEKATVQRRSYLAAVEVIARFLAHEWHLQMRMGVDATWREQDTPSVCQRNVPKPRVCARVAVASRNSAEVFNRFGVGQPVLS